MRVGEADEAITFTFVGAFVPDHLGLNKGGKVAEVACQQLICYVVAKITTKDPKVICNGKALVDTENSVVKVTIIVFLRESRQLEW